MSDEPTPERILRAGDEGFEDFITDTGKRTKRMLDGSVLDMLASRRSISGDQYTAGCQLYEDWYKAGFAASGVIDPAKDVVSGGRSDPANDRILDAAGRFAKALIRVGKTHSHPLVNIILLEEPLAQYGRKRFGHKHDKLARIAAITVLSAALSELDIHYYGQRNTRSGSSHADDYRPSFLDQEESR